MKYCSSCGKEIEDSAAFCSNCGKPVKASSDDSVSKPVEKRGPWKAFATTGFVLGIISLVFFWFPMSAFYMGGFGIVFSALGRSSVTNRGKARAGLIMSIISCALNIVATIALASAS